MNRTLRVVLIILVVVAAGGTGGYFLLPPKTSATASFAVARPADTVFAYLASTPAGVPIVKGVTPVSITSATNNVVATDVVFADGTAGTATYTISTKGEAGAEVALTMAQPVPPSPIARVQALTGGKVKALVKEAAAEMVTQIGTLKPAAFSGLKYTIAQLPPQPFFYIENCTSTKSGDITAIINQAVQAIPPLMRSNHLQQTGSLMAVEPHVVQGEYCYQVGYRYTGAQPHALLVGKFGESPSGSALHVTYTGTEDRVVAEVYDRIDSLLAATRLDDPTRTDDDWATIEIYNDDPTQAGGSRNREIYYVVPPGANLSRLMAIVPPSAGAVGAPEAAPEAPEAAASASSSSSSSTAPAAAPASSSAAPAAAPAPAPAPAAPAPAAPAGAAPVAAAPQAAAGTPAQ